jgi:hypothetical protein
MPAANLSIVFAPSVMRRETENIDSLVTEMPLVNNLLASAIQHPDVFKDW